MLYLITGPNGGGKTLKSIEKMHQLRDQGISIYAWGYHELKLPWVNQTLNPRDWKLMPPGSAMFVDEAQKIWRTRRGNALPPPELQDMEEHRYEGVDLYLISQDPGYLDSHIKGLVSQHTHCIPYGQNASRVFTFNECQDNPKSMTKRANAEFAVWNHPTQYHGTYLSSKHHMPKPPIPWRHRMRKVYFGAGALLALFVLYWLFKPADAEPQAVRKAASVEAEGSAIGSLFGGARIGRERQRPMTPAEWVARFQPRDPLLGPWSAPAYDHLQVNDAPGLGCWISTRAETEGECRCVREDGSDYVLSRWDCEKIVAGDMPHNPYKRDRDREAMGAGQNPARGAAPSMAVAEDSAAVAPVGAGSSASAYGAPPRASGTFALDPFPANPGGAL